jgi:multidrug efflux pump
VLDGITRGYSRLLGWSLRARWLVVLVAIGSGALSWSLLGQIKRELAPVEDRGVVVAQINGPDGSTLDYTNRYAKAIERVGESYPEFDRIFANIGNPTVAQGTVFFPGNTLGRSQAHTQEMAREMTPRIAGMTGVTRIPDHATVAGPGLHAAADQLRHHHLGQLPEPVADGARLPG